MNDNNLEKVLARLTKELDNKETQLNKLFTKGDALQEEVDLLKEDIATIKKKMESKVEASSGK